MLPSAAVRDEGGVMIQRQEDVDRPGEIGSVAIMRGDQRPAALGQQRAADDDARPRPPS